MSDYRDAPASRFYFTKGNNGFIDLAEIIEMWHNPDWTSWKVRYRGHGVEPEHRASFSLSAGQNIFNALKAYRASTT